MAKVHTTLTPEEVAAVARILDRVDQAEGSEIKRTGDISIEVGDRKYVIKEQSGRYHAALVDRPGD